jgi:hypothetical protein
MRAFGGGVAAIYSPLGPAIDDGRPVAKPYEESGRGRTETALLRHPLRRVDVCPVDIEQFVDRVAPTVSLFDGSSVVFGHLCPPFGCVQETFERIDQL